MAEKKTAVLCSGKVVEILEGEENQDILDISAYTAEGVIRANDEKWILPKGYLKFDDAIYNFPVRDTDVFVNGFPKSGTTWMQEIVWSILNNPDLDHPLQRENAMTRSPFFEFDCFLNFDHKSTSESLAHTYSIPIKPTFLEMYQDIPSPRVFKTHLYASISNKKSFLDDTKMVYVARHPMDSCHSFYLFHRYVGFMGMNKDYDEYADIYINGHLFAGTAAGHFKSWFPYRQHKNFYMLFYETMKKDPAGEIKKLGTFLGKNLTDKQIQNIIHVTSFKVMKDIFNETEEKLAKTMDVTYNEEFSSFFRKGTTGDSKNMPKPVYEKLSAYFKEATKGLDLPYTFE